MTPQEQQIIESLFQRLTQAAAQSGPRDPEAEALIQQRLQSFPGGPYYMAQTLILQERALQQAEARLNQQGGQGGQGSFLPGGGQPYQPPYQQYPPGQGYPPPGYQQQPRGSGVGGFLAGAGKMALGIGGGILVAEAATSLAGDLFGRHDAFGFGGDDRRDYDQDDRQGYDQGPGGQAPYEGYEQSGQQDDQGSFGDSGDSGDSGDMGGGFGGDDSGGGDW
jgi:uncharacterized protein